MANTRQRLCFLGLGNMGQGMSRNIVLKATFEKPLIFWNRTHNVALEHSRALERSEAVETVEEAVRRSDIVWSCLSNQEAVLDVLQRALKENVKGKLFVESSTVTPEITNQLSQMAVEAGAEFIAMPVFGEPTMAHRGILTCIPCGRTESVNRIRPFLDGIVCRATVDLSGEEPGKASLLKLIGNTFILNTMEMVAEGHVFAEKTNLGVDNLQKMIATVFPGGPSMVYSDRMVTGNYGKGKAVVHVSDARKLASHVLDVADKCGASLPAYRTAVKHLSDVENHVGPTGDISGIYGAVRMESGLRYNK